VWIASLLGQDADVKSANLILVFWRGARWVGELYTGRASALGLLFEIQSSLGSHWISWTAGEEERLTYYSPILRAINMTVAETSNFKTDQPARLPWIRYQHSGNRNQTTSSHWLFACVLKHPISSCGLHCYWRQEKQTRQSAILPLGTSCKGSDKSQRKSVPPPTVVVLTVDTERHIRCSVHHCCSSSRKLPFFSSRSIYSGIHQSMVILDSRLKFPSSRGSTCSGWL